MRVSVECIRHFCCFARPSPNVAIVLPLYYAHLADHMFNNESVVDAWKNLDLHSLETFLKLSHAFSASKSYLGKRNDQLNKAVKESHNAELLCL